MPDEQSNNQHEEPQIVEFDYDPLNPDPQTMTAKLIFNAYVESSTEYNEAKGTDVPIKQWRQVWESFTHPRREEDGKLRVYSQNINLEFIDKKTDKVRRMGGNLLPNQLATAFQGINVLISPGSSESEQFINHFFTLERRSITQGPYPAKLVWFPLEYHGAECPVETPTEIELTATKTEW